MPVHWSERHIFQLCVTIRLFQDKMILVLRPIFFWSVVSCFGCTSLKFLSQQPNFAIKQFVVRFKHEQFFWQHIVLEGIVLRSWCSKKLFCDNVISLQVNFIFCPTTKFFLSQGHFNAPQVVKAWLSDQDFFALNMGAVWWLLHILIFKSFCPTTKLKVVKTKLGQPHVNWIYLSYTHNICLTVQFQSPKTQIFCHYLFSKFPEN